MTIQRLATRYGTMYVPDTDTAQYPWLVATGRSWEDAYIQEVCRLLRERPGGVAIDGGACYGEWTLALVPHATSVWAYEPQPAIADLLRQSIAASHPGYLDIASTTRGYVVACALGIEYGQTRMPKVDLDLADNFGGISVGGCHEQPSTAVVEVGVLALDELGSLMPVEEHRESSPLPLHVSFIKLDLEGGELAALRGAHKTIERCRPIMFVETDHPRTDKRALLDEIESLGYGWDRRGPNVLAMPLTRA